MKDLFYQRRTRLLYICDWLPPDFGAVGQYSKLFARQYAESNMDVVLGGLSTKEDSETIEQLTGGGSLKIIKLLTNPYRKNYLIDRIFWTLKTNTRLVISLWSAMCWADEILFTGSPPLLLHWIAPLNLFLQKRIIYRITDFHPECLIASRSSRSLMLSLVYYLTLFWRRRVDLFEVLGNDQKMRLEEIGIPAKRIHIKRDPSPVTISPYTPALERPENFRLKVLLLYSGNWGVAHDYKTFVEGYRRHHHDGTGRVVLWLNAIGANADAVANALNRLNLPMIRTSPVALENLASLLVTPDAHLITLSDTFVGFVLPSKVYGCLSSKKPILYIGSPKSDVHLLCTKEVESCYLRINVGDAQGFTAALEELAKFVASNSKK